MDCLADEFSEMDWGGGVHKWVVSIGYLEYEGLGELFKRKVKSEFSVLELAWWDEMNV